MGRLGTAGDQTAALGHLSYDAGFELTFGTRGDSQLYESGLRLALGEAE